MPVPGAPSGRCTVCAHSERQRIDWLVACGARIQPTSEQFGVSRNALTRHFDNHVTDRFKQAAKVGPGMTQERLEKLCAESSVSVLETLEALQASFGARFAVAFEAGDDGKMGMLGDRMVTILDRKARLTRELAPTPSSVRYTQVNINGDRYAAMATALMEFARQHPEVRQDLAPVLRAILDPPQQPMLTGPLEAQHAA